MAGRTFLNTLFLTSLISLELSANEEELIHSSQVSLTEEIEERNFFDESLSKEEENSCPEEERDVALVEPVS